MHWHRAVSTALLLLVLLCTVLGVDLQSDVQQVQAPALALQRSFGVQLVIGGGRGDEGTHASHLQVSQHNA